MAERIGQHLGNYRLTHLLGRGGFAEVYLGEHRRLKTQAAIKVLHTQLAETDIDSFLKEAQIIAQLDHPHIVRVLDFDVQDGTPFLIMSYAPNGTLRQLHPRDSQLSLATIVPYVKQVADALQYAHDEKLIHRDIKPENMLLGKRNEVLLSDFGIALIAQSSRYQNTQDMAGTIAYMAPEQISAHPRPASDQYSLGIVVYEWLSGERPFHGSFTEIAIKHSVVPPPPLREKVPTLSHEVEQVVMTALAKDPKDRFGRVQAFANALEQASQSDAPTFVKPTAPTVPYNRVVTPAPLPVTSLPPQIEIPPRIPATVAVTPPLPPKVSVNDTRPVGTILGAYRGHSGSVYAVAWATDGNRLASASGDQTVHVWDTATGNRLLTYRGHSTKVNAVAWSPDSLYIASGSDDQTVQVWNATSGYCSYSYRSHSGRWVWVRSITWSPDGKRIVSANEDKTVHVWEALSGRKVFIYHNHLRPVTTVAWSPNGIYIASGSDDKTVQVWDATTGKNILTYRGHSSTIFAVAWSPDGKRIASGSYDATIQVWDATTGENVYIYRGHSIGVKSVVWSPNSKFIASASDDKTVQLWDAITGENVYTYRGHSGGVKSVAWSPSGKFIASASDDATVQVWFAP